MTQKSNYLYGARSQLHTTSIALWRNFLILKTCNMYCNENTLIKYQCFYISLDFKNHRISASKKILILSSKFLVDEDRSQMS